MMKKNILIFSALLMLMACGDTKAQKANKTQQTAGDELTFVPNVKSDYPLILSKLKDKQKAADRFPGWVETDVLNEYEGVLRYNLDLGYEMTTQQLLRELPGTPIDKMEVGRVIIVDLNKDGNSDALVCLGRYGDDETYYFDAYIWDPEEFGGRYVEVENFRQIPNPALDKKDKKIIGHKGDDSVVWGWTSISEIEKQ